jgi:hypothetical protein
MLISNWIPHIYYRISTSCQSLHLSVVYVISAKLEIRENCDELQEKFRLYCKEHEGQCCRICIVEKHSDCTNVGIMETIIKNVDIKQDNTILPTGSKEHPVIPLPLVFIFCFRFSCIFWTDIGCDRLVTIICACLSFFLMKFISQGFDSTISPSFLMQVAIVFRPVSILCDSLAWFRYLLLISDCQHVSCVSTSFSICFCTYNTVYIKDNNSVDVSSGDGDNKCIAIIDIESHDNYLHGYEHLWHGC